MSAVAIAQCCLPFGLYRKKLAANCARVIANYAQHAETAQILAFQGLRALLIYYNQA